MKQRIVLDIDRDLWRRVSIESARQEKQKRIFVMEALEEKIARVERDNREGIK